VVISDIRHLNELEFINGNGGICFAVDADARMGDVLTNEIYQHESEINIPTIRKIILSNHIDRFLVNNTIEQQKSAVELALSIIDKKIFPDKDLEDNMFDNSEYGLYASIGRK
jgi:hypothetical protein